MNFEDSKMQFSFPDADCFRIEHSPVHKELGEGIKICEAIVRIDDSIVFIEAKSSFPQPGSKEDFSARVAEAYDKFLNSILIYLGLQTQRPYKNKQIPANLIIAEPTSNLKIKCYYIIHGFQRDWLPPVNEAIGLSLSKIKKTLLIDSIMVINDTVARNHGLIQ